jgi:hypothetical protein
MSVCCRYFFQIPTDMAPTFSHTYRYLLTGLLMGSARLRPHPEAPPPPCRRSRRRRSSRSEGMRQRPGSRRRRWRRWIVGRRSRSNRFAEAAGRRPAQVLEVGTGC